MFFFIQTQKKTIKHLQNKETCRSLLFCCVIFGVELQEKIKIKKMQQQQMQGKRYSRYGKNNQLFN